jgi:hypothetical protein
MTASSEVLSSLSTRLGNDISLTRELLSAKPELYAAELSAALPPADVRHRAPSAVFAATLKAEKTVTSHRGPEAFACNQPAVTTSIGLATTYFVRAEG